MVRRVVLVALSVLFLWSLGLAQETAISTPTPTSEQFQPLTRAQLDALPFEELESRGDIARGRKDYLSAIDSFNAALRKQRTASVYNKLGMVYLQMMQPNKAFDPLKKALKANKTFADARNNLGVAYYEQRKYGKAAREYRRAIKMDPQRASFHSNLGTALMDQKNYEKGLEEYRIAYQLDPTVFERSSQTGVTARMPSPQDRAKFNYLMAKLYASNGQFDLALNCLRRAMEEGYKDINEVYKENDFAKLRADQRFTELMAARPVALPE